MTSQLLSRHAANLVDLALSDTRVVALVGPRQSGKTTLAKAIAKREGLEFLTLDDNQTRAFANSDPTGFIRRLDRAVIDEIQRAPDLVLAIKQTVDEDRRFGRFLITGSADLFGSSVTPDSLAGRVETIELLPLSQSELAQSGPSQFLDNAFEGLITRQTPKLATSNLAEIVLAGGYPEALARANAKRRSDWLLSYAQSLALRDVGELALITKPDQMLALVNNLAVRASQLLNLSALGSTIGVDAKSIERWLGLLERLFLITRVPAWHSNALKRLVRAPKVQFFDSGLVAALQSIDHAKLERDRQLFGPLLETFVFGELRKASSLTARHTSISHYRDKDQVEVDFVLERSPGHLIGIEVKASATIRPADIRGLTKLRDTAQNQFKLGIVLHDGDCVQEVSERIFTAPVSILWS